MKSTLSVVQLTLVALFSSPINTCNFVKIKDILFLIFPQTDKAFCMLVTRENSPTFIFGVVFLLY